MIQKNPSGKPSWFFWIKKHPPPSLLMHSVWRDLGHHSYFNYNIIRAANNHLIFRSYFKSDLHLLMFLRDFVLAILIKISYRALFFRRCPLPCKIFFSIQIFLLGTGHLQKKRAQLKSSKYFCWALFFWRCPRALFFWRCPVKIFEY